MTAGGRQGRSTEQGAADIMAALEDLGLLPRYGSAEYTADEEAIIRSRLKDLGYI